MSNARKVKLIWSALEKIEVCSSHAGFRVRVRVRLGLGSWLQLLLRLRLRLRITWSRVNPKVRGVLQCGMQGVCRGVCCRVCCIVSIGVTVRVMDTVTVTVTDNNVIITFTDRPASRLTSRSGEPLALTSLSRHTAPTWPGAVMLARSRVGCTCS